MVVSHTDQAPSIVNRDHRDYLYGQNRYVDITYESVDPNSALVGDFGPLTVTLNGAAFSSELRSQEPTRYGVTVPSGNIDFSEGCCGDLFIDFSSPQSEPFGLDNVVVDWSQIVPEPSSFASTIALGIAIWLILGRKTHYQQ